MNVRIHENLRDLLVDIGSVRQAIRNPNNGDVEAIAQSIEMNGFAVPILARRDTREIIVGNHRYAAMLSLGADRIPVIWLDMNDEQATRLLLADNRTARLGRDDPAMLVELLDELHATPAALIGTGWEQDDLDRLHDLLTAPLDLSDEAGDARQNRAGAVMTCPNCGHQWGPGLGAA